MEALVRFALTLVLFLLPTSAFAQLPSAPCQLADMANQGLWDLQFVADEGVRVDRAALPKPFVDETGRVHLFYQAGSGPGARNQYAVAADGLTFEPGRDERPEDLAYHPYRVRAANGVWRMFRFDPNGELRSRSSGDGIRFGEDSGVRYRLQPDDKGWAGIHDEYVDRHGHIVLLYLADRTGLNNVRRAISTDNGWTFAFDRGNVLGDSDDASRRGPSAAFVDQHTTVLGTGLHRLFAMRQGCAIYSFLEDDDGRYTLEAGARATVNSWPGLAIRSLHDPLVVRLADGRYRMYVCASLVVAPGEPIHEVIVSATTAFPPDIQ
jgi:hypothetical protein